MPTVRIYQSSDLAGSARRDFIEDASHGRATLRTPEGEGLVMLPEADLRYLADMRDYALAYLVLENALSRPAPERRPQDFGEWAFAAVFDDDDLQELRDDINAALVTAASRRDSVVLESTLHEWKLAASTLSDPVARGILGGDEDGEFEELARPASS